MKNKKIAYLSIMILSLIFYSCERNDFDDSIPKEGLVAYYSFEGGNANDLSGNYNNGVISGATPSVDRFLKPNDSFHFKKVSDYIKVNNPNFLNNNVGTFAAWVKFDNLDHVQYVASVGDVNSIENYISFIRLDPSSRTLGIYQREPGLANWINGTTIIFPDIYYHVVMLSDGFSWSIYINGKKEELNVMNGSNTGKWISDLPSIDNFVIGNCIIQQPYIVPYITGNIDLVLLYNRTLTESEINKIYTYER
ncbi:MAG: LamG domain-containing protein [Bacteroidales bacterium]|nr:LamG domain-containing protein [Bacteroidales bacterium]